LVGKHRNRAEADEAVTVALKAFQVIDTRDPDEFAAGIAGLVGRAGVEPIGRTNGFRARVRHLALGEVGIFHGSYERDSRPGSAI
jgi:rhodanese-related sulfurtransferase